MATLAEIDLLARDGNFRNRVQSAIIAKSEAILAETSRVFGDTTLPWSGMMSRINLARIVQASPVSQLEVFARKCSNNTAIQIGAVVDGAVTPYANMDNDIIFVVSERWNEIAGV